MHMNRRVFQAYDQTMDLNKTNIFRQVIFLRLYLYLPLENVLDDGPFVISQSN